MKKNKLYITSLLALTLPAYGWAQDRISFEGNDGQATYKSIGVYDSWDESPFRSQNGANPLLKGNVAVIDNPDVTEEGNASAKVLMVQRSRYGSNQFGARIDLNTPFELTTTTKYVHVMIKKDKPGRVLLIGLGKRQDRAGQSPETEQCWALSSRTIEPGIWNDAVFAIKGNGGIDIHSLVVVPDCESTHDLKEDFLVYIDEIEVNDESTPRIKIGDYPLNIEEDAVSSKNNYYVNSVALTSPTAGEQTINVGSATPQTIYRPLLEKSFVAKAGETVTPKINFSGSWMNGYVYLDKGQDGDFYWQLNEDYTAPENSDLVSYYYIETVENESGFNYKGEPVSGNNRNTMQTPAFKIPEDLKPGFYRLRFKVDWGNADPGGRTTTTNGIIANGGNITDVRLNIHKDKVNVTTQYQNGDVYAADGSQLAGSEVKFGEPLTIKMVPSNGFIPDGITLTHGYNLTGDSLVHGTPQYTTIRIPGYAVKEDGTLTIPASLVDGDLHILGHFKSTTSGTETGEYEVNFEKDLIITRTDRTLNSVSLTGNEGCSFTSNMSKTPKTVYQNRLSDVAMTKQGETITPSVNYTTGGPMHGYFYIDFNNDGIFTTEIGSDHRPTFGSELLSFSYYDGYNSDGVKKGTGETNNTITFPAVTIPEFIPDGVYRARLKIDWNNIDPKGQYGETNKLDANGGYVVDFLINISNGEKTVKLNTLNGNIYGTSNSALPYKLTSEKVLNVVPTPVTEDYVLSEPIYIRSGLNFDGPQYIRGNQQWFADTLQVDEVNLGQTISVPVYGNVEITANFKAKDGAAYKMIFNDEFDGKNGERADASKWGVSKRQNATWNRFISDSIAVAYIEDGQLVLKAIPNEDKSTDNVDMLTGALESQNKFSFKYGKVECRAKTNGYKGNFPAIWMMPQDQSAGWPNCGEIDIFEQIDTENKSYHTVHSNWTYNLGNKNNPTSSFSKNLSMDRYHTYGFEWNDKLLTWYVDGVKVGSYAKSTNNDALSKGQWPFDKEFYLILNQSVGNGSWAQPADINHTYRMDVDWIRVYQKDNTTNIESTTDHSLEINTSENKIMISTGKATDVQIVNINGTTLYKGTVDGNKNFHVQKGVYIVNNQKVLVP